MAEKREQNNFDCSGFKTSSKIAKISPLWDYNPVLSISSMIKTGFLNSNLYNSLTKLPGYEST